MLFIEKIMSTCFFCSNLGGEVLYRNNLFRIIAIDEPNYPGYLRIVLNEHTKELSDLTDQDNISIYLAVIKCEKIIRKLFSPEKINLASFGNMTPHVHWHIIPRFIGDLHFPNPTWGEVTNPQYIPSKVVIEAHQTMLNQFNQLFLALA